MGLQNLHILSHLQFYAFEALKAFLPENEPLLKLSDFTLYQPKQEGINLGGFYYDTNQEKWLLKSGHYYQPESVVKEYIAGGLYQLFLGDNAPQTEIVINDADGTFFLGSKLLNNFNTLWDMGTYMGRYNDNDFPTKLNGKPLTHFFDGIAAIEFLKDTDAHSQNVGVIDHGDHYDFAKIDHGFSFHFEASQTTTLDDFRYHLQNFYGFKDLNIIGFDEVYQTIQKISDIDFSVIEAVVSEKMANVHTYMDALALKNLNYYYDEPQYGNLETHLKSYQDDLLSNLKHVHQDYQKMADYLSLEKAILDHDMVKVTDLLKQGISLTESFKPFYNPIAESPDAWWSVQTQSTTALKLAEKSWPELLDSLDSIKAPIKEDTLSLKDLFVTNDLISGIEQSTPPATIEISAQDPIPAAIPLVEMHLECDLLPVVQLII